MPIHAVYESIPTLPTNVRRMTGESSRRVMIAIDSRLAGQSTSPDNVGIILRTTSSIDPFELQKMAFQQIPPLNLIPYSGKYVLSIDGNIVDSDDDLQTLA